MNVWKESKGLTGSKQSGQRGIEPGLCVVCALTTRLLGHPITKCGIIINNKFGFVMTNLGIWEHYKKIGIYNSTSLMCTRSYPTV